MSQPKHDVYTQKTVYAKTNKSEPKPASLTTKLVLLPLFILPRFLQRGISYLLALFWFYILRLRKKLVLKQIEMTHKGISKRDKNRIAFRSFYNLLLILFEYSYFPFRSKKVLKYTKFINTHYYDEALKEGKGVIIYSGHLGNGEIAVYRACMEGYPLHLIAKRVGAKFIDKGLFEAREVSGLKHIAPKNTGPEIERVLNEGASVLFIQDQFAYPPKGIPSYFLGEPTYTNSAMAHFALKTGAVLIPVKVSRGKGDISEVEFCPRIETQRPYESHEDNIAYMTQKYNDWLDWAIRKHPGEWMWVHRRWKRQPNQEVLEKMDLIFNNTKH